VIIDYAGGKGSWTAPLRGETAAQLHSARSRRTTQLEVEQGYVVAQGRALARQADGGGALARMLMLVATGHAAGREELRRSLTPRHARAAARALYSTLGRTACTGGRRPRDKIFAERHAGLCTTSWSATSSPATREPSTTRLWDPAPGRRSERGAPGSWSAARRARPLDRDRGRQDRITRPWCRARWNAAGPARRP